MRGNKNRNSLKINSARIWLTKQISAVLHPSVQVLEFAKFSYLSDGRYFGYHVFYDAQFLDEIKIEKNGFM